MFIVHYRDLDPVEDVGIFTLLVLEAVDETVPNFKGAFVDILGRSFHLPAFGGIFMKSRFLVGGFGVETTKPLGDMNLVDGPCIKKRF
jgi:hypothetical protein